MGIVLALCLDATYRQYSQRPEEGITSSGVSYSCEQHCGCCKLNQGPLEKEPVLLSTDPSLQSLELFFFF